jgi:predicted Zn-dependent protease
MTRSSDGPSTARKVANLLPKRVSAPWELFAQHLVHHEIHLAGTRVEMLRGPIELEGFALRIFRSRAGATSVGLSSSNDGTKKGVERAVEVAERSAPYSSFPAKELHLPTADQPVGGLEVEDPRVRDDPVGGLRSLVQEILQQFPAHSDVVPSFGSVRITHGESSVVNSAGLEQREVSTYVEFEWAVKASGGPEGRPAGEFWVNSSSRRLDPESLGVDVPRWSELARDVRRAKTPPNGELKVLFPARVLQDILPEVLGFRLGGSARLRKMAPEVGSSVGSPAVNIWDDPHLPWGDGSGGIDDEGTPTSRRLVVEGGTVRGHFYDALHASALGGSPLGGGHRSGGLGKSWHRFTVGPTPGASNLSIAPGSGGTDAELIEAAGEGIWLEQLGYAFPDPFSGAYGGEIRIGYRIRNGRLAEPVRGGTVGGLVLAPMGEPSLLRGVSSVGGKARFVGGFQSPTLLVEGIQVAGSS